MPNPKKIAPSTLRNLARKNLNAMNRLTDVIENGPALTQQQAADFLEGQFRLGQATSALITNLVGVSVNGLTKDVRDIEDLTKEAKKVAETIADVNQAINLLGRLATFSMAVARGDVRGILKGGADLAGELGVSFG